MTLVNTATGEITGTVSSAERRREKMHLRANAVRENVDAFKNLAIEAFENDDHLEFGYRSFKDYMATEYAGTFAGLDPAIREPLVLALTDLGMTTPTLAPILGVSDETVRRDIKSSTFVELSEDVIDAEIVDEGTSPPPIGHYTDLLIDADEQADMEARVNHPLAKSDEAPPAVHGRVMWSQARYVLDDLATKKYSLAKVNASTKKAMLRDLETITDYIKENI